MNKRYRLFGKIPVVDILIVLILISALAGAVWVLTRSEVKEETGSQAQIEKYPFTATFMVSQISDGNESLVSVGDALYQENGTYVGEVTEVSTQPYVRYSYDSVTGKQVGTVLSEYKNLFISVSGEASASSDTGTFIGKSRMSLGGTFQLSNGKMNWSTRVVALKMEASK